MDDGRIIIEGVNASISGFDTVLSSFDDGEAMVVAAGRGCWLSKLDIKAAYRHIPIHPSDYHLLGFRWRDRFYYDRCLPFGMSSSVWRFEQYSTAIQWMAQHHYGRILMYLVHYIDDYLLVNIGI